MQSAGDVSMVCDLIRDRTGLRANDTQVQAIAAIMAEALAALPVDNGETLRSKLAAAPIDHPLWRKVIHAISVGETYFFRNSHQFEVLRTEVLPALIAKRRSAGNKQLRLWSAGCATGEEPYSLAILLRELLPDFETWQITVLATDIDLVSLERAQQAVYRARSFRSDTPPDIRDRWFSKGPHGYTLDPAVRQSVIFQPLNLASADYPSIVNGTTAMDVIMCRNVTIYFDEGTTRAVVARLHQALAAEGWLVVGHAESMASAYERFTPRDFPNALLYQKTGELAAPPPSPSPAWRGRSAADCLQSPARIGAGREVYSAPIELPIELDASPSAWQRAKQAADLEQWQEALTWLAKAEDEDRFQPHVYHLRALIQQQLGDREGAIASLRQAVYCDASFALAHYALGEIYETARQYALAARHWRLAQTALETLAPGDYLPFADDMTVNMLQGLLCYRLSTLPAKG